MRALAEALDEVANFTHTHDITERIGRLAQEMMDKHISHVPFSAAAEASVRQAIVKYARKLKDLWSREEKAPFTNRVPEAQTESGEMGRRLVEFSFYGVAILDARCASRSGRSVYASLGSSHAHCRPGHGSFGGVER